MAGVNRLVEQIRNPNSLSYKLGMRRKIRLNGGQVSWYIKKHVRSTILDKLAKHDLIMWA